MALGGGKYNTHYKAFLTTSIATKAVVISLELLQQSPNQSSTALSQSILIPASKVIVWNVSDQVTFVRYFQWAAMLFKLKSRLHSDLQVMRQFILPLCLSDLLLYFLLLCSKYPYSDLIPLLSLKTQTIPNTNTSASLHLLALLLWNAPPHPRGIASLSHFLQNFTHVSLSFHIDFSAPCSVPDFLHAFLC